MTSYAGLTAKLPFASPFLAQYVYSIPPEILETGSREKASSAMPFPICCPGKFSSGKRTPIPKPLIRPMRDASGNACGMSF